MNVTIHDIDQRTDEWAALRLGRLTASRAADATSENASKKGEAAGRRNLRIQLVLERITGRSHERQFSRPWMQDGIDREPSAVALYEALSGVLIQPVGFVSHDEIMAGCSPDGLIGEDGLVSIKSPIPATHYDYLKSGKVPGDYLKQILHEFWITGRTWCDWCSYQPDFPESHRFKVVRVHRLNEDVEAYASQALHFLGEVETEVRAFRTMANPAAVLQEAANA